MTQMEEIIGGILEDAIECTGYGCEGAPWRNGGG